MNRRDLNRRGLLTRTAVMTGVSLAAGSSFGEAAAAQTSATAVWAPAARPGARNLITDVPGLKVGSAEDAEVRTGATVIVPDQAAVVASEVGGGGPATRETDATAPQNLVHAFDAVVLSGGSVYGLATADGVVAWLGARHRGYGLSKDPSTPLSPVVPAAALYDLANGGRKDWGLRPPYRALGLKAMDTLGEDFALGTAGAGYGAMAGGLKGGLGSASIVTTDGATVGALVAVNSAGSVVGSDGRTFWASPYELGDEFGGLGTAGLRGAPDDWGRPRPNPSARKNTTLSVVATDVTLTSDEAKRVAIMAQDGMARAIRPAHSPFDGDVVFAISTGKREAAEPRAFTVARIGALAADTLARAIARAVFLATPWPGTTVRTWKSV